MKTIAIDDTGATWDPVLMTWTDGEIFRETRTDLVSENIAEHLGYLKEQEVASAKLTGSNNFTGDNVFDTGTGPSKIFRVTGDWGAEFVTPVTASSATFSGQVSFADRAVVSGGGGVLEILGLLEFFSATLADANATIASLVARVPQTTANRVYTLPTGSAGQVCFVVRARASDAHTITIQDPSGSVVQGVMPVSAASWMVLCCNAATSWRPLLWAANVTSILATV